MTHVFIVNEKTFNIHLKYLFAGTGYQNNDLPCVFSAKVDRVEKTLTGMIADISKLRDGDKVLFYVTGCKKIYGVFEIDGEPFYEPISGNYLFDLLEKNLIFRVRIRPANVYAEGITEHEALDEIYSIQHPYQMCWSLIYRKLRGMRGCSFLTDYESKYIINLLNRKNNGKVLSSIGFEYDISTKVISPSSTYLLYSGITTRSLNILSRMCNVSNSFEVYLQAYITQNYDKDLKELLKISDNAWIGNEVVCSFGEQRIDAMIIDELNDKVVVRCIELKDETPSAEIITTQIPWYIKWIDQYVAPNYSKDVYIIPTIIAKKYKKKSGKQTDFLNEKSRYNSNLPINHNSKVEKLEYISFEINKQSNNINFCLE